MDRLKLQEYEIGFITLRDNWPAHEKTAKAAIELSQEVRRLMNKNRKLKQKLNKLETTKKIEELHG